MAGLLVPFQRRTGVEAATQDATGLGSLSLQRPLVATGATLLLPSASPVGRVRLTITNISGQFPGFQFYIPTPRTYLDCTAPGGDADGGTYVSAYNYPPPGQRTWRPVFAVPAVPNSITMEHTGPSSPGAMYRVEHAELLDVPAPPGAPHSWQMLDVETTTGTPPLLSAIGAANGPWTTSEAVGKALSVYATLDSPGTVTVPLLSSGGPIVARMTSKSGPPPVLVALGGATDNGDGTVTAPAGVRCFPAWDASADVTLVATKPNTGAYTVLYGPFYLDTPPIPPPAPTITKLIPTSGPDTGGTVVDIIGADLTGASIDFGGTAGTGLVVDPSGGLATVTTPAHTAGAAPVTITTPAGVSNADKLFTFEALSQPALTQILPAIGRPGTVALIRGANLAGVTGVSFGGVFGLDLVATPDALLVTVPEHTPGPVDVIAVHPNGETAPLEFTYDDVPVPPADVSPRSWQIAQALLDAAFLCGAECGRAFVTTDATPEGPPPGGCSCQLTATIVKDGYKTADSRRLVRSATIKLSLHQCTPIPQADAIPDPDTESDYALRQAGTRDQMLRGLATARRQPSSVLGRCQTAQASEGWVHVSTTGGMSLYTMNVTVD